MSINSGRFLPAEEHTSGDLTLSEIHSLREKTVREDIARRLAGVCSDFSPRDFEKLVALMAARQVKCERRAIW